MIILRYDTRHIRSYSYDKDFIKFDTFQDYLLPLAPYIFAQSSSLKIFPKHLIQCKQLQQALSNPSIIIKISYQESLIITVTDLDKTQQFQFSPQEAQAWSIKFHQATQDFSTAKLFGLKHSGLSFIEEFFSLLGISNLANPKKCNVYYLDHFYFIPFEFYYDHLFFTIYLNSDSQHKTKLIKTASIMFDPDLELSQEESLKTIKLLEKRSYVLDNKNPDISFISAHGNIDHDKNLSFLENHLLQELIQEQNPSLAVFNSCLLGQCTSGVISDFIKKGSYVMCSPFYTLCKKTIFAPLLRFLVDNSEDSIATNFFLLKIFYPNIYQYFRLYLPFNTKKLS